MDPNLRTNRSHFSLSASPLTYIGIGLIAVLVFIWYRELPAGVRADIMRVLPSMLLTLLIGLGLWSLWVSRERSLRVEAVESERDQIFSLSLDILCVLTMDGRFRRTNPAFLNVLGQRPDQLLEKAFTEIVHPDDMHLVLGIFKSLALGRQASFEIRCRCGDGSYNWLSWSANPIPHEGLIYAAAHDISARRNAEDALRAETAFRKAMEESVSAGLQAIDLKGRIIYVNRAFCEMVDRRAQDLIGTEPPFPYWHVSELDLQWHNLALCLSGKTPRDGFDARVLRRDGSEITVRTQVSPLVEQSRCADRLDDGDDRHHRIATRACRTRSRARTLHGRARWPRRSGVRNRRADGRSAVRQPRIPQRRRRRPRAFRPPVAGAAP
ncbi:MAG: PAS domain S-box protein [Rhodocyclaceae bacterium]